MVNHGLSTGMLFVMVGMLVVRGGSRLVDDYGGVAKIAPLLAGCLLLAGLSSLALPGTNSFVSEFLVLVGSYPREPVYTILATVGIIFAALYVLWFYQRTMQGPLRGAAVLAALDAGRAPVARAPCSTRRSRPSGPAAGSRPDRPGDRGAHPADRLIMVLGFVPGAGAGRDHPVGGGHDERSGSGRPGRRDAVTSCEQCTVPARRPGDRVQRLAPSRRSISRRSTTRPSPRC